MSGDPEQDALDSATDGPTGKSVGVYMTKEDGSVEQLAQEQAGAELELLGIDDDPNCPACQGVDKVALLADIKADLTPEQLGERRDVQDPALDRLEAAMPSREVLAAIEHERWAHWQRYMHSLGARWNDGSLVLPAASVQNWERQIATRYEDLSRREQESDLEQVDRYYPLIVNLLSVAREERGREREAASTIGNNYRAAAADYDKLSQELFRVTATCADWRARAEAEKAATKGQTEKYNLLCKHLVAKLGLEELTTGGILVAVSELCRERDHLQIVAKEYAAKLETAETSLVKELTTRQAAEHNAVQLIDQLTAERNEARAALNHAVKREDSVCRLFESSINREGGYKAQRDEAVARAEETLRRVGILTLAHETEKARA